MQASRLRPGARRQPPCHARQCTRHRLLHSLVRPPASPAHTMPAVRTRHHLVRQRLHILIRNRMQLKFKKTRLRAPDTTLSTSASTPEAQSLTLCAKWEPRRCKFNSTHSCILQQVGRKSGSETVARQGSQLEPHSHAWRARREGVGRGQGRAATRLLHLGRQDARHPLAHVLANAVRHLRQDAGARAGQERK